MKKTELFIQSLYRTNAQDLEEIKNEFESAVVDANTSDYGKRVLGFYNSISAENKVILFEIIEQTMIDSISFLLGIIDGNVTLSGNVEPPKLYYDGKDVSDEMQDLFLEYIEDMEAY